jgi:hypothetical protein
MDLWTEASRDVEAEDRLHAEARASAELGQMWPFFALAKSKSELEHRKAVARESLERIAELTGLPLAFVAGIVDRHFDLVVEASVAKTAEEEEGGQWVVVDKNTGAKVAGPFADREKAQEAIEENDSGLPSSELAIEHESAEPEEEEGEEKEASLRHQAIPEGENILAETVNDAGGAFPMGEVKPPEHDDGPDANIPPEAYGRADVQVPGDSGASNPQPLAVKIQFTEEQAREILRAALRGRTAARKHAIGEYVDPSQMAPQDVPPDATGLDQGTAPEGPPAPGGDPGGAPMGGQPYPETTKPRQMPGGAGGNDMPPVGGDAGGDMGGDTSDPVSDQIDQVTSAIRRDNPRVTEAVARRVARKAVAKMMRTADGIDYTHPMAPKPGADGKDENEDSLGGHAAETAGGMAITRAAPALLEELPLLAAL